MDCPYCKVGAYMDFCKCTKQEGAPICPHVYRCAKLQIWKQLDAMLNCPIRRKQGNVKMARHGYLYVQVDNQIIKVKNPYDYIPENVQLRKYKGNYKVVKENKENGET